MRVLKKRESAKSNRHFLSLPPICVPSLECTSPKGVSLKIAMTKYSLSLTVKPLLLPFMPSWDLLR